MRPVHRLALRLLTLGVTVLALVGAAAGCSLDEAELLGPETVRVAAEPGQLRVLSYPDGPDDHWIDAVPPDPEVFVEGDEFREQDSRTADDDDPAERRRLLTAVAPGRTLLVELNCPRCDRDHPTAPEQVTGVHVWDLVVGDPEQTFSAGTPIARPGTSQELAVGEYLVTVRPGADGPARRELVGRDRRAPLVLVASHTPDDGADLYVDVHVALATGDATLTYTAPGTPTSYPITVR